jgi:methylase of polypeptide subunit release factors
MSAPAPGRLPHAVLDLPSRRWKAMKIERLLGLDDSGAPVRMLEIGTGSGGIAAYFAQHPSGR